MADFHYFCLFLFCMGMFGLFVVRALLLMVAQIPMVYFFFPETKGLELEDVDHLFEKGGLTGGVFASRGHPVRPGYHRSRNTETIEKYVEAAAVGKSSHHDVSCGV